MSKQQRNANMQATHQAREQAQAPPEEGLWAGVESWFGGDESMEAGRETLADQQAAALPEAPDALDLAAREANASAAGQPAMEPPEWATDPQAPLGKGYVSSRAAFTGPDAIENSRASEHMDAAWRYYPEGAFVWSAVLNDEEQLKKLNYHHAYLLWAIPKLVDLADARDADPEADEETKLTEEERAVLDAMPGVVKAVAPPEAPKDLSGLDAVPADTSSADAIATRFSVVKAQKKALSAMMNRTNLHGGDTSLAFCWQPIRSPGNSEHGTGNALDMKGAALGKIAAISNELGATRTFNEASHLHVEFKRGVTTKEVDRRLLAEIPKAHAQAAGAEES